MGWFGSRELGAEDIRGGDYFHRHQRVSGQLPQYPLHVGHEFLGVAMTAKPELAQQVMSAEF